MDYGIADSLDGDFRAMLMSYENAEIFRAADLAKRSQILPRHTNYTQSRELGIIGRAAFVFRFCSRSRSM